MNLETVLHDSLKYIESNISESIKAEDVAKNAGYSVYYFSIDEKRWNEIAKETIDVFLPIAVEFNNEKVIAELNDLSVKYI